MTSSDLEKKAELYAKTIDVKIVSQLGFGTDGTVFETDRETAVKLFERDRNYRHELQSYQRLVEKQMTNLCGFSVPALINHSDALMAIEMTIVTAPYLIDFGKVSIDVPPDPISYFAGSRLGRPSSARGWHFLKLRSTSPQNTRRMRRTRSPGLRWSHPGRTAEPNR